MERQSVWQLSWNSFSWGLLCGAILMMFLGYFFLRSAPELSFYGLRYSETQPKSQSQAAQPRKLTRAAQAELVNDILAELTQENKNLLRQASSEGELYAYEYQNLREWIYDLWFKPLPRWESLTPEEDSQWVFEAVWREVRKQ